MALIGAGMIGGGFVNTEELHGVAPRSDYENTVGKCQPPNNNLAKPPKKSPACVFAILRRVQFQTVWQQYIIILNKII
jgi:hypothetical protein